MAVPLQVAPGERDSRPGTAVAVFSTRLAMSGPYVFTAGFLARPQYDVLPDGRFLMIKPTEEEEAPPHLNIVLSWMDEVAQDRKSVV